ncbi:transposase [Streptomyces erythrochromogenes]|uniref:transposase n=1 Tax=Streptomyces erythrochromogenes TaxID=285574 RepID=UPI003809FC17
MAENLTDRQAADAARKDLTWKYALGLGLADEGFDASVLSEFRTRMVEHGLEEKALDLLLAALREKDLVKAGGKQRTDSTHVISAVRDLNRLELAGESVRAVLEALAAAVPGWLATVVDIEPWSRRYAARIDSWRLPATAAKRADLAVAYGTDAVALLEAVHRDDAPGWLRELPAVQVLCGPYWCGATRSPTPPEDGRCGGGRRTRTVSRRPESVSALRTTPMPAGRPRAKTCSGWDTRSICPRPATPMTATAPPRT